MEERYRLFDQTIAALHNAGVLSALVLVGSWSQHLYKHALTNTDEIPLLITSDIDFLIPQPTQMTMPCDVPGILNELGYETATSPVSGHVKYIRRELEVEFLVPEKGRGSDTPRKIQELMVSAQGLRYLNMLQEHTITVDYKGIPVAVVEPAAYALHKFLVSGRRTKKEKMEKDLASAIAMCEYVTHEMCGITTMRDILNSLHPKWKKDILLHIKKHIPELHDSLISPG